MLKTTSNGTQATTAIKFSLRPTAETLADLSRPIDPRHLKTRKQGTATLTYCPWNTIAPFSPRSSLTLRVKRSPLNQSSGSCFGT